MDARALEPVLLKQRSILDQFATARLHLFVAEFGNTLQRTVGILRENITNGIKLDTDRPGKGVLLRCVRERAGGRSGDPKSWRRVEAGIDPTRISRVFTVI